MIEVIWEYVVDEGAKDQFELAYGPGGAWGKLFSEQPGYRGTTLLRESQDRRKYLTVDFWDSEAIREKMLVEREEEYENLLATFEDWTESKREVGVFRVLAEGTIRPKISTRHDKTKKSRRRSSR
jgi:heme-degrading monooxygenase HmoA